MKNLKCILLLFISINTLAQSDNFPNLNKINLVAFDDTATFGYDSKSFNLINKKCLDLPKGDFLKCDNDELEVFYKLGEFKSEKFKQPIIVGFSFGMSVDPTYVFFNSKNKIIGRINAWNCYLNSNGLIYSSGHTNNMFDKKRKFDLKEDTITEVIQPFYYVGLKTSTKEQLTIYANKNGGEIVAILPKDYEIEVLLSEYGKKDFESERYFLIKTKFGLIGWIAVRSSMETGIEGLYYAGD